MLLLMQISAHTEGNKQNTNDKMGLYVEMYLETRILTTLDYFCLGPLLWSSTKERQRT